MRIKLVLFSSKECGRCSALRPKLEELALSYGASFEEVDIDRNPEVAAEKMVFTAPAVILEVDGKESARWAGIFPLTMIESLLRRITAP
ncbi:thioredoxin family protein [Phorcysia thermohydrogeniphila]|uniref:Thioredoxin n=1 Tax=Phorcysia thermohydrogeniphila TaxID=936138 RepID=A0A4R1GGX7_9BACT|nr:thioredoxin family protein [Phorcysia thermohydrogeniphila]TCK03422.1 thioredoxin [Phorcysia thermohydrogeniphila]